MNNNYNKVDAVIETFTGNTVNVLSPDSDSIDIVDIAHSLAMQCRYTGHCSRFYSVAEHSVLVSHLCPEGMELWGLLHDATEAYITDIASPVKALLNNYKDIERDLMGAVALKFGLDPLTEPLEVKKHDLRMLLVEARELMPSGGSWWAAATHGLEIPAIDIQCWSPERGKLEFLKRFDELTGNSRQLNLF